MENPEEDTLELVRPKRFADHFFASDDTKFSVEVAAETHPGKVRPRNEDHYAVIRRARSCDVVLTNLEQSALQFPEDQAYCLVVADGIGGAAFGEFASQLALNTALELAGRATSWVMKFTDLEGQELRDRVDAYVEEIQKKFRECSAQNPLMANMGTTLTCACLLPPHMVVAHIGDSRAYLQRGSELWQITRDQTLAQDMVDAGADPQDVKRFGNLLMNSLGGDTENVQAEVLHADIQSGDRVLLCSDGLTDMVPDATIADVLQQNSVQPACQQLVQRALQAGGKDNITVVLCELQAVTRGEKSSNDESAGPNR